MTEHYDFRETRSAAQREAELATRLPALIAHAQSKSPAMASILREVNASHVNTRAALAALPVTRKSELLDLQKAMRPFGGFNAGAYGETIARVYASPGPIYEPEGVHSDYARVARALFAAGLRKGDLAYNTFSYHMTPGGWIMDAGLRALGCAVIPAGPGNTEQQLDAIQHIRPTGYCGVPDYLKILLDKAKEAGRDVSSITKAFVSGGALFPSLRAEYQARGISCFQAYATAELA